MEVVASLSQGRTAAAQCGFFIYKSVPVIFEPPCILKCRLYQSKLNKLAKYYSYNCRVKSTLLFTVRPQMPQA